MSMCNPPGLGTDVRPPWQVFAVEVMWTPQDPNDSYSKDELFEDFPTLNTL